MRRAMPLGLLGLLLLAGCQNTMGPLQNRLKPRPDNPDLSAEQQKRFGRDRYSTPDDSPLVGPRTGVAAYGPTGR